MPQHSQLDIFDGDDDNGDDDNDDQLYFDDIDNDDPSPVLLEQKQHCSTFDYFPKMPNAIMPGRWWWWWWWL